MMPNLAIFSSLIHTLGKINFRTAKDLFALVGAVKECLQGWETVKLDLLIKYWPTYEKWRLT